MPVYQYACTSCGHDFDARQSFHDDPLTECPECGGTLRKKFSAAGVVFKGSGFYRTDSRKADSSTSSTGSGGGSGSGSSGSSSSSDSGSGSKSTGSGSSGGSSGSGGSSSSSSASSATPAAS